MMVMIHMVEDAETCLGLHVAGMTCGPMCAYVRSWRWAWGKAANGEWRARLLAP